MKTEDLEKVSVFLEDFQSETDRGAALVGAAMVESRLERILDKHLIQNRSSIDLLKGFSAPIATLSAKTNLCHALGLITDKECSEIIIIRKIRNTFAHTFEKIDFSNQTISDLCKNLNASQPGHLKKEKKYRELFINSVILVSLSLWYRPEYAKKLNASQQHWEYQL